MEASADRGVSYSGAPAGQTVRRGGGAGGQRRAAPPCAAGATSRGSGSGASPIRRPARFKPPRGLSAVVAPGLAGAAGGRGSAGPGRGDAA